MDVTLVGGGREVEAQRECLRPFFAAVSRRRASEPRIGLVWVDEGDGTVWTERPAEALRALGVFRPVDLRVRVGSTLDPARLEGLDGLLVCPGLTPAYADALAPAHEAVRRLVLDQGLPYAGASAGAAVAAETAVVGGCLDRGRVVCPADAAEDLEEVTVQSGLGLLLDMVDVHAAAWGTLPRLESAMRLAGVATGLAIDEDTAWYVGDDGTRVLGRHAVHRLELTGDGTSWSVLRAS